MNEERTSMAVVAYSYDCDDDSLVLEFDGEPEDMEIESASDFVAAFLSDVNGVKSGLVTECGSSSVGYDAATDTFSIDGVGNIDAESLASELEAIYNAEM